MERELLTAGRWNLQGQTRCGGDGMMRGVQGVKETKEGIRTGV